MPGCDPIRVDGCDFAAKSRDDASNVESASARVLPRRRNAVLVNGANLAIDVDTSIAGFWVTVMIWVNGSPRDRLLCLITSLTDGPAFMNATNSLRPQLKICRVDLDTGRENVAVISRRSKALRPEVFRGFSRVELRRNSKLLLATLLITDDDSLVGPDDLGLAEPAFRRFAEAAGSLVTVTPAAQPNSLDAVRAKIQGHTLSESDIFAVVDDLVHYRYSDMEIAAFLISSARLSQFVGTREEVQHRRNGPAPASGCSDAPFVQRC